MNKVKIALILVATITLIGCDSNDKLLSAKEVPVIVEIITKSTENQNKALELESVNKKLITELKIAQDKNKQLTKQLTALNLDKDSDLKTFWEDVKTSLNTLGTIGFFMQNEYNTRLLMTHISDYVHLYQSSRSHQIPYLSFPEIKDQPINSGSHETFWSISRKFRTSVTSFAKRPTHLQQLFKNFNGTIIPLMPVETKLNIIDLVDRYRQLLELAQDEEFHKLAQQILEMESRDYHENNYYEEVEKAQKALAERFPKYSLLELQAAYRNLITNQDDWEDLATTVKQALKASI